MNRTRQSEMSNKMSYSVYRHTTPSGKVYIGMTGKKPEMRWRNGTAYSNNFHFNNAKRLYGWDNIAHDVLLTGLTKEQAEKAEVELISKYDSTNQDKGYNLTNGGECIGKHTEEFKRRASKRMKRQYETGEFIHPMLGKHFSEESKEKMRKWHRGKKLTEEHKRNIGIAGRGKNVGAENPMAKAVYCIETGEVFGSIKEAADSVGLCRVAVSRCVRGLAKTSGGLRWAYVDEPPKDGDAVA